VIYPHAGAKMLTTLFLFLIFLTTSILAQNQNPSTTPAEPPSPSAKTPAKPAPCLEAKSQLDLNECYANFYQSADTQLNATYNNIVGFMKKNLSVAQHDNNAVLLTHNETSLTKLLAAQRAWLAYRDAHCDSVKFQYEGGSIQPMAWSQCMADITEQRITTLSTAYDTSN
jgi:uncharacterized protein YecT (DUF1311 family)